MNGATVEQIKTDGGQMFYGKLLSFKPKQHRYFWGGEPVPSVTTILGRLAKPALIQWAADCAVEHIEQAFKQDGPEFILKPMDVICAEARKAHVKVRDSAGDKGTSIHDYARDCFEQKVLLPVPEADAEVKQWCAAFGDWWRQHTILPVAVERMIMSERLGYAGRTDFFGRIDTKLGVLDIKTGGKSGVVYDEVWLQMTGYELALVEELQIAEPLTRWVLQLDKRDGTFKLHERAVSAIHCHAWVALTQLDKYMRALNKAA